MTFAIKKLYLTFELGTGSFGMGGANVLKVEGPRILVSVQRQGSPANDRAQIRVWGLALDIMAKITTLGAPLTRVRQNKVTIEVGDDSGTADTTSSSQDPKKKGPARSVLFAGIIQQAVIDFAGMPDVSMSINATAALVEMMAPVAPISFSGGADVAVIMSGLARQMNMAFENNGVSMILRDQYYPGTALQQAESCAKAAGIDMYIDSRYPKTMVITNKGGYRKGTVPLITPRTGLVGYPSQGALQIAFRVYYNPSILFNGLVKIAESQIPTANGTWTVNSMDIQLSSEVPGGPWFMDLEGYRLGDTPTKPSTK